MDKRGFAVFFTGLSGSGKTTITSALIEALQSLLPTRRMTILDGDVVRTHLSKELGFSIKVGLGKTLLCANTHGIQARGFRTVTHVVMVS